MREYTVKFELFNHNFQATICANSEPEIESRLMDFIKSRLKVIHKELKESEFNECMAGLENLPNLFTHKKTS